MPTQRTFLRVGIAVGALMTCAPVLVGVVGTMVGMTRAFNTLGQSGIGDPRQLSRAIGETLLATAGGVALFPFGLALLLVCGILLQRSRRAGPPPLPRFPEKMVTPPDNR